MKDNENCEVVFELDFAPPMNKKVKKSSKKSSSVNKIERNSDTIDWVEELTGEKYARVKRGQSGY